MDDNNHQPEEPRNLNNLPDVLEGNSAPNAAIEQKKDEQQVVDHDELVRELSHELRRASMDT